MHLVFFDNNRLGVMDGDSVIDVSSATSEIAESDPQNTLETVICNWGEYRPLLTAAVETGPRIATDSVVFQSPVPRPGQLVCLAGNYIEPDHPKKGTFNAFLKSNTSVMGHRSTVKLPEAEASVFHFEPELALVIGRRASNLTPEEAMEYIFGYTQFIDVSARGLPGGFFLGKSWHTFGPMGPALVTADELGDANQLPAKLWVNDELKHDFNTSEMGRHIPELLAEVTSVLTLLPGDVVSTGTHHYALSPIQDGDTVTLSVSGLGPALSVDVKDDLNRTWER